MHLLKVLFPPEETTTTEKNHGRIETRKLAILTLSPGQVSLPFANQIFSITRTFSNYSGKIISAETILRITSLTSDMAGPERILSLNRGHWTIENKIHYVRDVTMGEDFGGRFEAA
ncbi:MAG: hypothetical protein A2504_17520 [Bdellovibrionales bacterium RIFOXYD12_FULL_39_22]|nr:MAG: hypothetical protein A2385_10440 [Bdellovibrionales bacterium RIFOXYB1_FULL_39_21]OFZ40802.1 MAG: hypothetical protein A2485_17290 [Bdellovibrionales bacterium RIFOXYC12_FULL_39_17]OFZ48224.1 MAG: hypothetical protein A2404_17450 [Bdellovibrionales bacterium RIFOXYC1_FULL_39_130]OFZ75874.1 MAG: hypothetical protein A2560_13950 [Bdellovibrionales bacterium RIFOXYD1_FULL_39_84]OFZ91935.1 MAG: hypothetical protein A2504_17520 [Bdellovibrionales bacterium RIFOXYD12_FULL_39_22]